MNYSVFSTCGVIQYKTQVSYNSPPSSEIEPLIRQLLGSLNLNPNLVNELNSGSIALLILAAYINESQNHFVSQRPMTTIDAVNLGLVLRSEVLTEDRVREIIREELTRLQEEQALRNQQNSQRI